MKTKFKHDFLLTEEEKKQVSEMTGKTMLWILEGRSDDYMSKNLKMSPWQIQYNIDETLYTLKRYVGLRRFIKILFWK